MAEPTASERTEDKKIIIRWRRFGRTGGKWRAELPEGNGLDSGFIESSVLSTVERFARVVAARYGYPVVFAAREAEPDA